MVIGRGSARALVWPGIGAEKRSLHLVSLAGGDRTRTLRHPGEAVYYVREGTGEVVGVGMRAAIDAGAMMHVQPARPYRFVTDQGMELLGGPCPPDPAPYSGGGDEDLDSPVALGDASDTGDTGDTEDEGRHGGIRVLHRDRPDRYLPMISADARLVVWPGVGARDAPMNYVRLLPGEQNDPHVHLASEDTIFVLSGEGTVADLSNDVVLAFEAGDVIHVPPGVRHAVRADRGVGIESVGGPAPADEALAGVAREARAP